MSCTPAGDARVVSPEEVEQWAREHLGVPTLPSMLPKPMVRRLCAHVLGDADADPAPVLRAVTALAQSRAVVPVSQFRVGVAGVCAEGHLFAGANVEYERQPLFASVHAEQSLVCLMHAFGATAIGRISLTAAPCGLCRQFMAETRHWESIRIRLASGECAQLSQWLPHAFGPKDLQVEDALLSSQQWRVRVAANASPILVHPGHSTGAPGPPGAAMVWPRDGPACPQALEAALHGARRSYAPYSRSPVGVGMAAADAAQWRPPTTGTWVASEWLQCVNGNRRSDVDGDASADGDAVAGVRVVAGSVLENAAYNPSMGPFQGACCVALASGLPLHDVREVVLVELCDATTSHTDSVASMVRNTMPLARLHVVHIDVIDVTLSS